MENTLKKSAINYGIYLGLIVASITVLAYAINLDLFTQWWYGIIILLIIIIFGIVSSAKAKSILNGFISFKQAFASYFIPIAVGIIINAGVSILLFNVVDPEAAEIVLEKSIEATVGFMERLGTPQDVIDEQIAELRENNQFGLLAQLKGIAWQLLFYSIIGLIVAAIMKKKDPNEE
jgi:ABC-type antimicrobial peptide transport system permease subunit